MEQPIRKINFKDVQQNPSFLQYCHVREIIVGCVERDPRLLKHVLPEYQSDPAIVLIAIEKRANMLCYADKSLKYDEHFLRQVYEKNPKCYIHFPKEIKAKYNHSVENFLSSSAGGANSFK